MVRIKLENSDLFALADSRDLERILSCSSKWYLLKGYAVAIVRGITISMHHVIVGRPLNNMVVDHVNADKLDNRAENLRYCSFSENLRNSKTRNTNRSGFKGVDFHLKRRKFRARIYINGKRVELGYFEYAADAHKAYSMAANKYFGEFARTA